MEEDREEIWDEEEDKPSRKISQHILEGKEPAELKGPK